MNSHPFTDEDIRSVVDRAFVCGIKISSAEIQTLLGQAWDSAVKRGAVDVDRFDDCTVYKIMGPEEKS